MEKERESEISLYANCVLVQTPSFFVVRTELVEKQASFQWEKHTQCRCCFVSTYYSVSLCTIADIFCCGGHQKGQKQSWKEKE